MSSFNHKTDKVIDKIHFYYRELENKQVKPFANISNKKLLLDNILYSNLEYFPPKIYINFFLSNKKTLKELFNISLNTNKLTLLLELPKETINKKANELLQNLLGEIKERENFLHFLSSYLFLFSHSLCTKPSQKLLCLKAIIPCISYFKWFDEIFQINIQDIVSSIISNFLPIDKSKLFMGNSIDINDFRNIFFASTNSFFLQRAEKLIDKFLNKDSAPLFTFIALSIKDLFTSKESTTADLIKLFPFCYCPSSDTVTILVSGFLSENCKHEEDWKNYIEFYGKENNTFYCFQWPSETPGSTVFKSLNNLFELRFNNLGVVFKNSKQNAKVSGNLLGLLLTEGLFFQSKQINLVGFSLGCHVVKNCIRELYQNGKTGDDKLLGDVKFFGGATCLENKQNWQKIFKETIGGSIYNFYSKEDDVLKKLFKLCIHKEPIGLKELLLENSYNVDLTNLNIGHLDYRDRFREILPLVHF